MTYDGCGINMVLPKWANKILTNIPLQLAINRNYDNITFPKMGKSIDPQVSAAQCTRPEAKSAEKIPATPDTRNMPKDFIWN